MRRFAPWIAVVLIYAMTPMAAEVTENLVHLATQGHLAHALPDARHDAHHHEHGCSPTFHVCGCHTSGFVVTGTDCVAPQARVGSAALAARTEHAPEGHLRRLLRPPIGLG